jgi:hypothetical protein
MANSSKWLLCVGIHLSLFSVFCTVKPFPHHTSLSALRDGEGIRSYYDKVVKYFAAGNAKGLTELFAKNITQPMKIDEIFDWAHDFFEQNGPATFIVENLALERIDTENAVALLTYRVKTNSSKGNFHGVERDYLVKMEDNWIITAWDKV